MITFDKHIEILLLDNDCVIVPGLGGFMAHHSVAQWDDEENVFLPPFRTIGFNPQLKLNDNLLVQSYIERYDISYPEALRMIEKEVLELKQFVESGETFELSGVGQLSQNSDGKYSFEPCEAGILTPELYGFSSVPFKKISSSSLNNQKKSHSTHQKSKVGASVKQLESFGKSAVSNIAIAAVACIAFLIFAKPVTTEQHSYNTQQTLESSVISSKMTKINPDVDKKAEKITFTNTDKSKTTKEEKIVNAVEKERETKLETTKKAYHTIVLASRVTKANAEEYVNNLHKKGYTHATVLTRNSRSKVIFGNYNTEQEAYQQLRTMRTNEEFKDAWVMRVE